jgi:hypothetical protein
MSHSQREIGGVTATGQETISIETSGFQHAFAYWWDEDAITSWADNDIDFEDGISAPTQVWSFIVFAGVNQTTPVVSASGSSASSNTLNVSSTSGSGDRDLVVAARSSGNRDVTNYDTLSEGYQDNTGFTSCACEGAGGDATITLTGDGVASDWLYTHLLIQEATAGITPQAMYHYRNHGKI